MVPTSICSSAKLVKRCGGERGFEKQNAFPASARSPGAFDAGLVSCPTCGGGGSSSESGTYGSKRGGGSGGGENMLLHGDGEYDPPLELPVYVRVGDGVGGGMTD